MVQSEPTFTCKFVDLGDRIGILGLYVSKVCVQTCAFVQFVLVNFNNLYIVPRC